MRRLSADEALALFQGACFKRWKEYYANQYYGALKWIAESNFAMVLRIANPYVAVNFSSFFFLFGLLIKVKFYWFCFFASSAFEPADRGRFYSVKRILQVISFILFFWFAIPVRSWLMKKATEEWERSRTSKNGSDLFLILKR